MSNGPLESILTARQKSRRGRGEVPYPITYSRELANFDIWDHMFRVRYCKNLTMHEFVEPPELTLDLGCGSGFWAMEAAKQWQTSTIIGFDIAEIQPRLEHFRSLSPRLNWVRGNLLDGLPFPPNHFDFVRVVGMGLAIPEDEWQHVLEEIHRVLKPGAVLEIIEENLLFPCSSSLLQKPKPSMSSPLTESPVLTHHVRLPRKRSTLFGASLERTRVSPASSVSSIVESPSSKPSSKISNLFPLLYTLRQASTVTLTATPSISTESYDEMEHPQDHTRLKTAWDEMLNTRFLSPNPLSVIPFYLTSMFSVTAHTPVLISLPPNSGVHPSLRSPQSMGSLRSPDRGAMFDFFPALSNRSIKTDGFSMPTTTFSLGSRPQPATMHLAKIISVIKGCKQAIWSEYEKLYSKEVLNILARTAPDEEYASQPYNCLIYRAFEIDWNNWIYDMTDRIGMRKNLQFYAAWTQPTSKDDQPDCQTWRDKLGKDESDRNRLHFVAAYNPDDLCRSIQAFTARKM